MPSKRTFWCVLAVAACVAAPVCAANLDAAPLPSGEEGNSVNVRQIGEGNSVYIRQNNDADASKEEEESPTVQHTAKDEFGNTIVVNQQGKGPNVVDFTQQGRLQNVTNYGTVAPTNPGGVQVESTGTRAGSPYTVTHQP